MTFELNNKKKQPKRAQNRFEQYSLKSISGRNPKKLLDKMPREQFCKF